MCLEVLPRVSADALAYYICLYLPVERGVKLRHYVVFIVADTLCCKFHISKGIETLICWLRLRLFERWLLDFNLYSVNRIEGAILG